jgi:glycosyltransferase involved in cell wall biosynthesis
VTENVTEKLIRDNPDRPAERLKRSSPGRSEKIRVVHYANNLGLGGTERSMELLCRHLDPALFDVHVVSMRYRPPEHPPLKLRVALLLNNSRAKTLREDAPHRNARIESFREMLGDRLSIAESAEELRPIFQRLRPEILHVHFVGAAPPLDDPEIVATAPILVTTNPFEMQPVAAGGSIRRFLFVSEWLLRERAPWANGDPRAAVLPNPIDDPIDQPAAAGNLRAELGIPPKAFVIGRIGRPDPAIYDPIALDAYRAVADDNTWFLAAAPPTEMVRAAQRAGLKHFVALPPSADWKWLSRFYATLDVFAHSRRDGETFGCAIAEAMIHGVPVVSHLSGKMEAHVETIGDGGRVVARDDWRAYANVLATLRSNMDLRRSMGEAARLRARSEFSAAQVTRRLEAIYTDLLAGPNA